MDYLFKQKINYLRKTHFDDGSDKIQKQTAKVKSSRRQKLK